MGYHIDIPKGGTKMTTEGYYTIIRTTEYYAPRANERVIVPVEGHYEDLILPRAEAEAWIEEHESRECVQGASSPASYHLSRYTTDDLESCDDEDAVEALLSVEY